MGYNGTPSTPKGHHAEPPDPFQPGPKRCLHQGDQAPEGRGRKYRLLALQLEGGHRLPGEVPRPGPGVQRHPPGAPDRRLVR